MNEPACPSHTMSDDEQRLIRLFRCLNNEARSETLQRLGKLLMMEAAVDSLLNDDNPGETARQELHEPIDERLQILKPIHSVLMDLLDYDSNVIEVGWREASVSVADVILGSGQNDDEFAGMLVEAYLEGANKYDVPLPCDFASPEESNDEAVQAMRQDLHKEAVTFIESWRENVIRRFEQAP